MGRFRSLLVAVVLLASLGCATPPRTAYTFDNQPGGWEVDTTERQRNFTVERYAHAVHGERLEIYEVRTPPPATGSDAFNAQAQGARGLPPLHSPGGSDRAVGDDVISGTPGYWVAQYGHDGSAEFQGAAYVVPRGRRFYIVRMSSSEDEFGQLQAWVRDLVTRNLRFPPPTP
jgi:hypothetical protein